MQDTQMEEIKADVATTRFLVTVQDIISYIRKGEELLKNEKKDDDINYYNAIILSPKYQRKYRSTVKDATAIIESLIKCIPLPEIFLVTSDVNGLAVRNVMDGQHRLSAIYGFLSDDFSLNSDYKVLNGKKFSDLDNSIKLRILNSAISILEFQEIKDSSLEIELFKIYNSNQKPLSQQELNSATFPSKTLDFIDEIIAEIGSDNNFVMYKNAFNLTTDRVKKKKVDQEILAMLHVMKFGVNDSFESSPIASGKFMKHCYDKFIAKENEELIETQKNFEELKLLIRKLVEEGITYPCSSQVFSNENYKNYKFNIGIGLVYAYILHYYDVDYNNSLFKNELSSIVSYTKSEEILNSSSCANSRILKTYVEEAVEKISAKSISRKANIEN